MMFKNLSCSSMNGFLVHNGYMAGKKQPVLTLEQAADKYGFDIEFDEIRTKTTHCKRGHRLVDSNTRKNGRTQRLCWICEQQRRGRIYQQAESFFTHCIALHELSEDNLVLDGSTWRCKTCISRRKRDHTYGKGAGGWYETKLEESANICELCKEISLKLVLDHNHETGELRGLICGPCNVFLGQLEKRINMIETYLSYARGKGDVSPWLQ